MEVGTLLLLIWAQGAYQWHACDALGILHYLGVHMLSPLLCHFNMFIKELPTWYAATDAWLGGLYDQVLGLYRSCRLNVSFTKLQYVSFPTIPFLGFYWNYKGLCDHWVRNKNRVWRQYRQNKRYICVSWHLCSVQDVDVWTLVVRPFCPFPELLQLDEISDPFS